jgi:hypothetical protein
MRATAKVAQTVGLGALLVVFGWALTVALSLGIGITALPVGAGLIALVAYLFPSIGDRRARVMFALYVAAIVAATMAWAYHELASNPVPWD